VNCIACGEYGFVRAVVLCQRIFIFPGRHAVAAVILGGAGGDVLHQHFSEERQDVQAQFDFVAAQPFVAARSLVVRCVLVEKFFGGFGERALARAVLENAFLVAFD
jgi:hypothetical protein